MASRGGAYLWEHPADPGCDPYPSIWITAEMMEFEKTCGRKASASTPMSLWRLSSEVDDAVRESGQHGGGRWCEVPGL